jgi:hypothetical protein
LPSNPNELPALDSTNLPPKYEDFIHLHNQVGLPLLKKFDDLAKAFMAFGRANEVHKSVAGRPSGEALYNSSCCLARAVEQQVTRSKQATGADASVADVSWMAGPIVAPELPPGVATGLSIPGIIDARLDLALEFLSRAVEAGCATGPNPAHMQADSDLRVLRELRGPRFQAVLQQAAARHATILPVAGVGTPLPTPSATPTARKSSGGAGTGLLAIH